MVYLLTFYYKNQPNVGKCTRHDDMDWWFLWDWHKLRQTTAGSPQRELFLFIKFHLPQATNSRLAGVNDAESKQKRCCKSWTVDRDPKTYLTLLSLNIVSWMGGIISDQHLQINVYKAVCDPGIKYSYKTIHQWSLLQRPIKKIKNGCWKTVFPFGTPVSFKKGPCFSLLWCKCRHSSHRTPKQSEATQQLNHKTTGGTLHFSNNTQFVVNSISSTDPSSWSDQRLPSKYFRWCITASQAARRFSEHLLTAFL